MNHPIDFIIDRISQNKSKEAIIYDDLIYSYDWLIERIEYWQNFIISSNINSGSVVGISSAYNPDSIALFIALIKENCVLVPITTQIETKCIEQLNIAQCEYVFTLDKDSCKLEKTNVIPDNELLAKLKIENVPGLILFSSGTTGKSKAAVHNLARLMQKYHKMGKDLRTIAFMMFDHIGGVDTLFYALSNGSTIIIADQRTPDYVCKLIQNYRVEVLPVTPTFLNLMLISKIYRDFDLSSLVYITYGTEVMPEETLRLINSIFPKVKLQQKFGTTEVGTLRSKSRESDSLWVKFGGEGYTVRIVDGLLQIKAESAMLGYLNAPSPFTADGWYITGDMVEQDGEWIKILGRESDLINVGGEKVFPSEVENVILKIEECLEATVYGEKHPLMGNIVCARVNISDGVADEKELIRKIKKICSENLEGYKVPIKIFLDHDWQYSERFKKKGTVNE